jgi:hypothetical protein
MNRLFLFLSVVSFCIAHHGFAHAQTIIIRQSDFAGASAFPGSVASSNAPMRIVPATIGRSDPSSAATHRGFATGLLVPRPVEATPTAAGVVVSAATPSTLSQ